MVVWALLFKRPKLQVLLHQRPRSKCSKQTPRQPCATYVSVQCTLRGPRGSTHPNRIDGAHAARMIGRAFRLANPNVFQTKKVENQNTAQVPGRKIFIQTTSSD
eukprot:3990454-Prymnesium_polylepis.1